ncbi:MAG: hypothetical protein JWQ96_355 [Segetibacter sp.]|nr:hypothetical protein [Segetibacter sp.]
MERIKVHLPESFNFSTVVSIRITDLNYGGHVGNDSFLSLIHEARQQFLKHHGYGELDFAGIGLIMADSAIEYKRELNHQDQVKISVTATAFDKLGFDIYYLMEVITPAGLQLAGKVKTGMLCFDYTLKKKVAVPLEAIQKLSGEL